VFLTSPLIEQAFTLKCPVAGKMSVIATLQQPAPFGVSSLNEVVRVFARTQPLTSRTTRSVISRRVTSSTGLGGPNVWTSIWPSAKNSIS
jgi:hypothetical protein